MLNAKEGITNEKLSKMKKFEENDDETANFNCCLSLWGLNKAFKLTETALENF